VRDFACRLLSFNVNDPGALNSNHLPALGNASAGPSVQFCGRNIPTARYLQVDDTTFAVRLRDTAGRVAPPEQIIVRRQ